jgi:divalent metal cation (Fe/Co/Zn/Cd) transporter
MRIADRGTQVTVIGLVSNVGLTAAKGLAGWYMNSASLLADAGHSFSGAFPGPP